MKTTHETERSNGQGCRLVPELGWISTDTKLTLLVPRDDSASFSMMERLPSKSILKEFLFSGDDAPKPSIHTMSRTSISAHLLLPYQNVKHISWHLGWQKCLYESVPWWIDVTIVVPNQLCIMHYMSLVMMITI